MTHAIPAARPLPDGLLPYGPVLARLLRPIQRGFQGVNGLLVAPALRLGLGRLIGNPLTGRLMVLRTRGRVTGRLREAPLGYVIRDGAVWCVAGYGRVTPWYRNLLADPLVEVVLPGRTIRGVATPVDDPQEWVGAFRELIGSFGLLGRIAVGPVDRMTDEAIISRFRTLPIVRIDAAPPDGEIRPGTWERGLVGAAMILVWVSVAALVLFAAVRRARSFRSDVAARGVWRDVRTTATRSASNPTSVGVGRHAPWHSTRAESV